MGQRLVFECKKDGKRFATIYYHWSGYTGSIYYEAARLIEGLKNHGYYKGVDVNTIKRMLLDIIQQHSDYKGHGGMSFWKDENGNLPELEAWKALGVEPIMDDVNRNEGLIDITEKGMEQAVYWAEALEEFNFDTETFTNNEYVFVGPSTPELLGDYDIDNPDAIPVFNYGNSFIGTVKWEDAEAACEWFNSNSNNRFEGSLGRDAVSGDIVFATE